MILDIVLVLMLGAAALNGWRSGAVSMLLSLVVLAVAAVLAAVFGGEAGTMLHLGSQYIRPVIGFVFVFVVVLVVGGLVRNAIKPKHGIIRGMDGLAGAAFALVRAAFVLSVFLMLFRIFHFPPESWTADSKIYSHVVRLSGEAIGVIKPALKPAFKPLLNFSHSMVPAAV